MQKTLRFAIVVAYFFAAAAWGPASARGPSPAPGATSAPAQLLSVSPSQYYVGDVENFLTISGAALGQVSTVITYTQGDTVLTVDPQIDLSNPRVSEAWVPLEITNAAGHWDVRVVATNIEGTVVYGPSSLDIIERPEIVLPPTLPEVLVVEAGSLNGGALTFDAGGATCDVESGANAALGTIKVTCTLGNDTYSFDAVVTDSTPPVLTLPSDIVTLDPTLSFTASAVDNLDGPLAVTCAPSSGTVVPDGETLVQCEVSDAHLNHAAGSFLVTVGPPVFHLDGDITTEAVGPNGNVVTYSATVGSGTIECLPASGALFPVATTTVNCSATNAVGSSAAAFNVAVVDTTPPSLISPSDFAVDSPNASGTVVNYTTSSTDIVSGVIPVICSTPSGSTFPVGTTAVQCSATDARNNTTTASFNVTVAYNPPPAPLLTAGPAQVWFGLKDNSNKGVTFDLLVEVLLNGAVVGSGQTDGVGGGPGFGNAVLRSVALTMAGSTPILPGDTLGVRVSARIAASSPRAQGTARLWINDAGANSRVSIVIQGTTTNQSDYFLRAGSVLGAVGSGPKITVDVDADRNVGGNAFIPFGVWTVQY
jgi:hypothetical protein